MRTAKSSCNEILDESLTITCLPFWSDYVLQNIFILTHDSTKGRNQIVFSLFCLFIFFAEPFMKRTWEKFKNKSTRAWSENCNSVPVMVRQLYSGNVSKTLNRFFFSRKQKQLNNSRRSRRRFMDSTFWSFRGTFFGIFSVLLLSANCGFYYIAPVQCRWAQPACMTEEHKLIVTFVFEPWNDDSGIPLRRSSRFAEQFQLSAKVAQLSCTENLFSVASWIKILIT